MAERIPVACYEAYADPCRDWLFGGFGDDFLFGGPDNDSINGDIVPPQFMNNTGPNTPYPPDWIKYLDLYEGSKQIQKGDPLPEFGSDILHGNWGNDWMYDPGSTAGIQKNNFYGEEGDDVLIGGENTDFIWGGPGDDEAWGNAGEGDQLYGDDYGDPNDNYDKLYGGEGKDFLSVADVMLGGPNPRETLIPAKATTHNSRLDVTTETKMIKKPPR